MYFDPMRRLFAAMIGLGVCLAGTAHAQQPVAGTKSIVQTAVDAGSFQTLVAAAKQAGLVETLSGPGPLTVFAPTDEAFAALPAGTVESLLLPENKAKLANILTYHVVAGRVMASDVIQVDAAETVAGPRVQVSTEGGGVQINDATVVQADIACSNGVIHVIDKVLLPVSENIAEVASGAGQFGTLLAAADAAGLVPVLTGAGPLTVFAPTDEAFSALPKGTVAGLLKPENKSQLAAILKYHVVAGRVYSNAAVQLDSAPTVAGPLIKITPTDAGANINSARLIATDIDASNGVIHVIDRVLLPTDAPSSGNAVAAMKPAANSHQSSAKMVLLNAIQQGVPIYNGGDHHGCAAVYMQALEAVAAMNGSGLSAHSQNQMQQTLNQCRQMTSSTSRAWALRNRMDQLLTEL